MDSQNKKNESSEQKKTAFDQYYVIGWNMDENVLLQTSSGGLFQTFAKMIVEQKGWVFGTEFSREKLAHVAGYNDENYKRFSGSKYVKSDMSQSYKTIKERLDNGEKVLFGGTPCQCDALKHFLKKDYENLYMVDIICHGSPRAKVFEKYLCYLEKKHHAKVVDIKFRNKDKGWKTGQIAIEFSDGTVLKELFHPRKNKYANIFYSNIALGKGCNGCRYNTLNRCGDITLGDFWGYKSFPDKEINENGTSVILVNSQRGKELLEMSQELLHLEKVEKEVAISDNPPLYEHTKINPLTEPFCKQVEQNRFVFAYYFYLVYLRYALIPVKIVKRLIKR